MQPVGASFHTPGAKKRGISCGKLICHIGHFRGSFTKKWCDNFDFFQQVGVLLILEYVTAKPGMKVSSISRCFLSLKSGAPMFFCHVFCDVKWDWRGPRTGCI